MQIRRRAHRPQTDGVAEGESTREVIALGDQQGTLDSERIPRPLARGDRPAASPIEYEGGLGGAKPEGKLAHRRRLVASPDGAAEKDPLDGSSAKEIHRRPNPIGKNSRRRAVPAQARSEDDRHGAGRSLGDGEDGRGVLASNRPAWQAEEQGPEQEDQCDSYGRRNHPGNHGGILPDRGDLAT